MLARQGTLKVTVAGHPARPARAILTPPHVPHDIAATDCQLVIVFVEPESSAGELLAQSVSSPAILGDQNGRVDALEPTFRALLSAPPQRWAHETEPVLLQILALFGIKPGHRPVRKHPAVARVVRYLRENPHADTSLQALSEVARLSPDRLMHAFTEVVGVPIRPYVRWLKLERAAAAIARGTPLSQAAIEAGFADAAHMTRTFRDMYGVTPSELRKRSQSVQER